MALAPRLAPGSLFARDFKIVDLLAEGGMGAVYRAEQQSTRKLRALKLVSTRLASDPKGRERFVREATVGASIDSEHAVEVIGAGIDEATGRPWLAMELLDGADLGAVVQHQGPLSPSQWREVMGQLCHGLAAAHRAGVVHRDLKPANVFVARSRRAGVPFTIKILDFGIAKVVQESGSGASDTDTVGSPLWMAPEQLNAQRPTPATDVWALGLLAFWALTGLHYWLAAHAQASTVQALFVEQLFKPLVPPSARAAELGATVALPPGFDAWFLRCTHRDPPQRFPDAKAASDALLATIAPDPAAAARLLPEQNLPPSISASTHPANTASTLATAPTAWDASAVVKADTIAAARSSFEGASTRADPPGLGADLSSAPLTPASGAAPRSGTSPLAVMASVAVVAGLIAGGGYLAWQSQKSPSPRNLPAVASTSGAGSGGGSGPAEDTGAELLPDLPVPPGLTPLLAPEVGTTGLTDPDPTDALDDPMLELIVPQRVQLDRAVHELRFLGWSASGHRFAVQAEHRADHKGKTNRLTLIEVHDALSGEMVDSYLISREADEGISSYHVLSKAAAQARPKDEWSDTKQALALSKQGPTRARPGGGQLALAADDAPPDTRLEQPRSSLGVAYRWSSVADPLPAGPDPHAPTLTVSYEHEGETWPLFVLEPPFTHRFLAQQRTSATSDPALVGRVLAFWSPDASRVFLQVEAETQPPSGRTVRHWALRAAGPQVRLVEAGAGQPRAREVAAQLASAGLPIAAVDLRAPPVAQSRLVAVRKHEGAEALAERIHAVLTTMPAPEAQRRRREFAAVVIILGQDLVR